MERRNVFRYRDRGERNVEVDECRARELKSDRERTRRRRILTLCHDCSYEHYVVKTLGLVSVEINRNRILHGMGSALTAVRYARSDVFRRRLARTLGAPNNS